MKKYNSNLSILSDSSHIQRLGSFIRHHRLQQNITQADLAEKAGINRTTLSEFERGTTANLSTFIQLLRVLDLLYVLDAFTIEEEISPLALAKNKKSQKKRRRASGNNTQEQQADVNW